MLMIQKISTFSLNCEMVTNYGNIYSMCGIFHSVLGQVILKITLK